MKIAALLLFLIAPRGAMVEGNPGGAVKVQIFEDLQSDDSARFEGILERQLIPKYGVRVAFVHRDFPLAKHGWARNAAIASRWVHEQQPDLGLAFRREVLSEQDNITDRNLNSWLAEFAARNHLDPKGIVAALKDPRLGALIDQDAAVASARGITQTPAVYAGGQAFAGTITYDEVAVALDQALQ